ncbi:MAG: hypothetical protein WD960_01235 [Gemmatimonadota bacterium]
MQSGIGRTRPLFPRATAAVVVPRWRDRACRAIFLLPIFLLAWASEPAAAQPVPFEQGWDVTWEDSELADPVSVTVADNEVWVADLVTGIHRWSLEGEYLGPVGRRGEGPGEYQSPVLVDAIGPGQVAVVDQQLRRVTLFGTDGEAFGTVPLPEEVRAFPDEVRAVGRLGDDLALWLVHRPRNLVRDAEDSSRLVRVSASGEIIEVVHEEPNDFHVVRRDATNTAAVPVPFADRPQLTFLAGSAYALGRSAGSSIRLRDADSGEELRVLEFDATADELSGEARIAAAESVRESLFGELEEQLAAGRLPESLGDYFRDKFDDMLEELEERTPARAPLSDGMFGAGTEALWLMRPSLEAGERTREWRLLTASGSSEGCGLVATHAGEPVDVAGGPSFLVAAEMSEEGLPRLVRYEVPEGIC